jgi:hypothetical protein
MASKNLGAVIQRAISDGAFRRQLQSDPAAALRGFNLTAAEIAAIRSGDSSKLMSLGVDQRMSKAFSVSGANMGGTRSSVSDLQAGGTASTIANDPTAGTREGIVGDPTSGARQAVNIGAADGSRSALDAGATDTRDALTTGQVSGTRAVHDSAPFDSRSTVSDPTLAGTRAIHDSEPFDSRAAINDNAAAASAGRGGSLAGDNVSAARAVNDSEPFAGNAVINDNQAAMNAGRGGSLTGELSGTTGTSAVEDPNSTEFASTQHAGDTFSARAVNDVAPFGTTGTSAVEDPNSTEFASAQNAGNASSAATVGDPYSGQYQGVSPDFQAGTVSSHMVDAGTADSIRAINDVAPFDSGLNTTASGGEFLTGDARLDPGTDSAHGFVPSDSADVQRELLDPGDHGNALGNTGTGHPS